MASVYISLPHGRLSPFYPSLTLSRAHYAITLSVTGSAFGRTGEQGRVCSESGPAPQVAASVCSAEEGATLLVAARGL